MPENASAYRERGDDAAMAQVLIAAKELVDYEGMELVSAKDLVEEIEWAVEIGLTASVVAVQRFPEVPLHPAGKVQVAGLVSNPADHRLVH